MDPTNPPTNPTNTSAMSDSVPSRPDASESSAPAGSATAQQPLDSRMDIDSNSSVPAPQDEDEEMPGLQEVSDSEDEDDDDLYVNQPHDVEMRPPPINDPSPSLPSRPEASTSTSGNRRARVEDDDDRERDRRHPSERASSRAAAPNDLPPAHTLFRIHMTTSNGDRAGPPPPPQNPVNATGDANTSNNNNNANAAAPPVNPTPLPNPPPAANDRPRLPFPFLNQTFGGMDGPGGGMIFGGMMSIPLFGTGNQDAPAGQPAAPGGAAGANTNPPPLTFATGAGDNPIEELLSAVGLSLNQALGGAPGAGAIPININLGNLSFGLEEKEDPERAKKLVDGLEDVPVGLVKRLVRVGGTGGGMGEDESKGGDAGCAICWDSLLDAEGEGFGKPESAEEAPPADAEKDASSSESETKQPRIVSLPCAHVFHADCLIPWFSRPRQTTCPTCRFNIDPDNLTYVSAARRERERRAAQGNARPANADTPADGAPAPAAAPTGAANANTTAPGANPPTSPPPAGGLPANDPLAGLQMGQSITMEMVFGLPLPPLHPPGPGQAGAANPTNNGERNAAGGAGENNGPRESARDILQREAEQSLRDMQRMQRLMSMYGPNRPRQAAAGENAQGPANNRAPNDEREDQEAHDEPPAERPHRASSAPPPSTAPLPGASSPSHHGATGPASPPLPHPGPTSPRGTQLPPFLPNLFSNPTGPTRGSPFITGSGQSLNEALTQMFGNIFSHLGGLNPPPPPGQAPAPQQGAQQAGGAAPAPAPAPAAAATEAGTSGTAPTPNPNFRVFRSDFPSMFAPRNARREAGADAPPAQPNDNAANNANDANATPLPNVPPFRLFPFPLPGDPLAPPSRSDPSRPKPAWTLPPAPGPTLRQRIERRERDAGLRCYDVSCGIGPSDEEPELSETIKQLSIKGSDGAEVCAHRFHSACLVSAERVAMAAHSAELVCNDGNVEVSCPVCRGAGSVTQAQWDEGVTALA